MTYSIQLILPFLCALLLFTPLCQGAFRCPNCGSMTVPYPLSTSSSCGDQQYKVGCNISEGKLSFNVQSGSYPIISISPNLHRLVVGAPSIDPSSCSTSDLHGGGFVLDPSLPFNITSSNTIFLLNCSAAVPSLSTFNCTPQSLCSQFLAQDTDGTDPCVNKTCCTLTTGGSAFSYVIKVGEGGCTAYMSVLNPSRPLKEWNYGIELEWVSPLEPICTSQSDCDKLSKCQTDPRSNASRCLCNQGYQWSGLTGTCTDNALEEVPLVAGRKKKIKTPLIAGIVVGILLGCGVLAFILYVVLERRAAAAKKVRAKLTKERQEILTEGSGGRSAKLYTSQEMKRATHNFANERLLGSGGFGDVYKGVLEDNSVVAVKSAKVGTTKGIQQVLNEVRILSRVHHRALVMLLGCCVETEQPLLVYEYIPNGTLLDHLSGHRGVVLDWHRRLKVAMQTAEGLAYLHSAASPPIYHCDVKSSNILLDAELNAKVSDFGISRLARADLSHITTRAQGTLGYLDPEYYQKYQLTAKSDVYSFGVVLLEVVTSQKAIDFARGEDDVNLAVYMGRKAREGRVMEAVDPRLLLQLVGGKTDTASAHEDVDTRAGCESSSTGIGFDSSSTNHDSLMSTLTELESAGFHVTSCGENSLSEQVALLESIYKVVYLALTCLHDRRCDRPSMTEVAEKLQCLLRALDVGRATAGCTREF